MKHIAKKLIPLFVIICILIGTLAINVSAAGSTIAFSKSKLSVGETLTVTARFSTSSGDPMYALECYLTYDYKMFDYVESSNANKITDGKIKIVLMSDGKVSLAQDIKLKAKKAGSSAISVESITYIDKNDIEKSLSSSSAPITVVSASEQASSNANLTAINVSAGTLVPTFSPNVTSYNITIPYTETEFWVQPAKADSKATYLVYGSKEMKVGANKRSIVVTAENGQTKTYTLNITRLAEDGSSVDQNGVDNNLPENSIEVLVGEETKYISEEISTDNVPKGFNIIDYVIGDKTVPAVGNNEYVMLYLVNPDGTDPSFYIINADGTYKRASKLEVGSAPYYLIPAPEIPSGYTANPIQINGVSMTAYKSENLELADFYLVYAIGPQGHIGFYSFDTLDKTMQRATVLIATPEEPEEVTPETDKTIAENILAMNTAEKIVAITILLIILLLIAAIVILITKIASSAKTKNEQFEEPEDLGEIEEGFEYIEVSNALESPENEE